MFQHRGAFVRRNGDIHEPRKFPYLYYMRFGAKVKDVSSCSMDASETYIFVSRSLPLDKVYVILVLLPTFSQREGGDIHG